MIYILWSIFMGIIGWIISELFLRGLQKFRRKTIVKWEWKDIKKFPMPEKELGNYQKLLISDGKKVEFCHLNEMASYNRNGKELMTYSQNLVTHWSYWPLPPDKNEPNPS